MKPEIGFVSLLSTDNIIDDVKFAINNKFDWLELALDWPQNFDMETRALDKIKLISDQNGLNLAVHAAYYLPIANPLPEIKAAVITNLIKAVDVAATVGADRITVHPGMHQLPPPATKANTETLIDNLKRIVAIGKGRDIKICFENFPYQAALQCTDLTSYKTILDKVPDIAVTLDVGHVNTVNESPESYFDALKALVLDIHIHDNNGERDEHKCPGEGTLDFKPLLAQCKKSGYHGPFMLEVFPYETILKARDAFIKLWEEA